MASQTLVVLLPAVIARAVPFVLNTLVLSRTPPRDLGTAAQVDLIVSAGLELLRDPLRLVVTSNRQLAINLSYISILGYLILIPPILYLLFGLSSHVLIMLLAHVLELVFEPYLLISQYINLEFGRRSTLESLASITKCVVQTYITLKFNNYILGFALGELIYSLTLLIGYFIFFKGEILTPKNFILKEKSIFIDKSTWSHYKSSILQQIVKLFLSQGDKFLISTLLPLEDQGYYSLVDNYGSLIPRLIFAPLEESTRINLKSQLESKKTIDLDSTFDIYSHFLPLLTVFGPFNINFLMAEVLHRQWPLEVQTAFSTYFLSLPLLGINGILEAMTVILFKDDTNKHSLFMTFNAIVFYFTMILFVSYFNWGLSGFILANMVNSFMRIIWNFEHVSNMLTFSPPFSFLFIVTLSACVQLFVFGLQVTNWWQFIGSAICGAVCVASGFFNVWRKLNVTESSTVFTK